MRQHAIIKVFRISRSGISEVLSGFQGVESISDRARCGRPQKRKHKMVQKLRRTAKVQSKKTARQVMDECDMPNLVSVDIT